MRCNRSDWPGLCLLVVFNPRVLSANWVDLGFLLHELSNLTPPPQTTTPPAFAIKSSAVALAVLSRPAQCSAGLPCLFVVTSKDSSNNQRVTGGGNNPRVMVIVFKIVQFYLVWCQPIELIWAFLCLLFHKFSNFTHPPPPGGDNYLVVSTPAPSEITDHQNGTYSFTITFVTEQMVGRIGTVIHGVFWCFFLPNLPY